MRPNRTFYRRPVVNPDLLLFAPTHEWVVVTEEDGTQEATIGISGFAVEQLTDLVHIELPEVGAAAKAEEPLCEVESVKAVSDIYAPVTGEVSAVNEALRDAPESLSEDPYGIGWIAKIRVSDDSALKRLMDHAAYQRMCAEEA
jgi:glycine cleavage system H protein